MTYELKTPAKYSDRRWRQTLLLDGKPSGFVAVVPANRFGVAGMHLAVEQLNRGATTPADYPAIFKPAK